MIVLPGARIRSTLHPDGFHGNGARAPYFEGWYVKLVDREHGARIAVIPGVFRGQTGADGSRVDQAFVQVLDGSSGRSWYHPFDLSDFHADAHVLDVTVGANHFTSRGVSLDLPGLTGDVRFTTPLDPWPVTVRSPGVMGWYAWMPFMECYHGVCSFGHGLSGQLTIDGTECSFDGGRGYIEKDWGRSFPSGYVWMHSNHFTDPSTSLMGSVALIPWLRSRFRGLLVGIRHGGRLHAFATHTGATTTVLEVDDTQVRWSVRGRDGSTVHLAAERVRGALLHAPARPEMHKRVEETLDATVAVRLTDAEGHVLIDDVGTVAGLEVFGDIDALLSTAGR